MESFRKLGIIEPILKSLEEHGFTEPTFIQEKAIASVIAGKDVVGKSATGSGKTLAFACGIIQNTNKGEGLQAIVLTPTRELAEQVSDAIKAFSRYKRINVVTIYGGTNINKQIDELPKADVVVATPGRMMDHMQRETIDLSKVSMLVLDEADRMVDMGFIQDVNRIVQACPKDRQTVLFSATFTPEIKRIEANWMRSPIRIQGTQSVNPAKLEQIYYDVPQKRKFSLLVHLLQEEKAGLVIVFCNTRHQVDFVAKNLRNNNLSATAIHGGFTQSKRNVAMQKFKDNKVDILICTDVAARGIDITGVSHVYNYDLPADPKEYIHRIGRTARAGSDGKVINLVCERDHQNFGNILYQRSELTVKKVAPPQFEGAVIKMDEGRGRDGPRRTGNFSKGGDRGGPRRGDGESRGPRGPRGPRSDGEGRGPRREGSSGSYHGGSRRGASSGGSRSRSSEGRSSDRPPRQRYSSNRE